jgi:hypothetical protein
VEVDAAVPTLVFRAKDPRGEDAINVRVLCDGGMLTEQLDGTALSVNPGPHTFRFEINGVAPFERTLVVGEGEKNRLVLGEAPVLVPPKPGVAPPPPPPRPVDTGGRASNIPGIVALGIGVAATVPMTVYWVLGTRDVGDMRASCAPAADGPGCPASRINRDRLELVTGDVFLGVAVVGVITGTVLLLTRGPRPSEHAPATSGALHFDASPTAGGAFFSTQGSF